VRPTLQEIDLKVFESLVAQALEGIPEPFSGYLEGVVVQVEEQAAAETREALGLTRGEELLGLYTGRPVGEGSFFSTEGGLPPRIILYRRPILRGCRNIRQIIRRIRETVVHEVGHHFGLSDTEMPY